MRPSDVRRTLGKRRAYLQAKLEAAPAGTPTSYWQEEVQALDVVMAMLVLASGLDPAVNAEHDQRRVDGARRRVEQNAVRCSCERCPVHAADRGAETAAMRAARGPTVGEYLDSEAGKARKG